MRVTSTNESADKRNKVCTAVGKSLKAMRIAANKSQETLAFDAGVDRTYISQIERGMGNPSILTLANLCHCLDTTMADLFAPVKLSLAPESDMRRANRAQPEVKPKASRLR